MKNPFAKKKVEGELQSTDIALKEVEGLSQGQIVRRRFFHHRGAMASIFVLGILAIFVFSALDSKIGPVQYHGWWHYSITDQPDLISDGCPQYVTGCPTLHWRPEFLGGKNFGIGDHPFGQDDIGRDYFALTLRGAQRSLIVVFIVGLIAGLIGTVIGAIAGFYRGVVDAVLMRLTDFVLVVPTLVLGSVVGFHFGSKGVVVLAVMLGFVSWTGLARLVRGEFLKLRELDFVDAARVAGASNRRIIFKHILPNAVGVIIVSVTLLMAGAILLESALSYIGFGVVSPDTSLGLLISTYQDSFSTRPWLFWWPGLFIIIIALSINFIGDGLRDAFDPRQRRRLSRKEKSSTRTGSKKSKITEVKGA